MAHPIIFPSTGLEVFSICLHHFQQINRVFQCVYSTIATVEDNQEKKKKKTRAIGVLYPGFGLLASLQDRNTLIEQSPLCIK